MFNAKQVAQLLQPVNPARVMKDGKGHSHLSQQDVLAHLTRVFGFGAFDYEMVETPALIFEDTHEVGGKAKWSVGYVAYMRLTVRDPEGNVVCTFEDGSTGEARNQPSRADAHDLALKSAISVAKKRCAIALGDQFGLSLYNRGQMTALVMGTLVQPGGAQEAPRDVQEGVAPQESLGIDETAYEVEEGQ